MRNFKHRNQRPCSHLFFFCLFWGVFVGLSAQAYITAPVATLGGVVAESTYVTVFRVEKVSREKGIIVYTKVRDLKGKYPKDSIRHVFDLKNTPPHKGQGDVPIRPDAQDWKYALDWAEPGKTAILFTRQYEPFGDFGHTYINGCWYATMCPPRDWQLWYAIYADPKLLNQWHCGSPARLIPALEAMIAGRDAVVPVLVQGTKDDVRAGRATLQGLRVATTLRDFNLKRDCLTEPVNQAAIPALIKSLREANRDQKVQAARALGLVEAETKVVVAALADAVRNDPSGTVRMSAAEALWMIGPDAKLALPALEASLEDPRLALRKDVLTKLTEVRNKLK
jgi:hypothetical protein